MNKLFAGKTIQDVVHSYSDTLIRIAFQNTKNRNDAEDIVQEVFIKLIKFKGDFQNNVHLKSWLIKVTINKCKDHFRSAWFRKTTAITDEMNFLAPEEQGIMDEIFQLDKIDRNIIYLYYYEGYYIKEIAEMLGKKQNTISSRLQRARIKLKLLLDEGRAI